MRKIDSVPMTDVMCAWNGLRSHARSPVNPVENVNQRITSKPTVAPVTAPALLARRLIKPSKNSPSMPPANTPLIFHHASRMLSTPIIASATPVPMIPHTTVITRKKRRLCASSASGLAQRR